MPSLAPFTDIARVFETFIERGSEPLVLRFKTRGAATYWRQRAYKYRKALQATLRGPTPYDELILRLADSPERTITIMPRPFEAELTDLEGNPIELKERPTEMPPELSPEEESHTDRLLLEAQSLRSRLIE
jgi:hypothetical protein